MEEQYAVIMSAHYEKVLVKFFAPLALAPLVTDAEGRPVKVRARRNELVGARLSPAALLRRWSCLRCPTRMLRLRRSWPRWMTCRRCLRSLRWTGGRLGTGRGRCGCLSLG